MDRQAHSIFDSEAEKSVRALRLSDEMNSWERRYAAWLELRLRAGQIQHYSFEIKIRLAKKCYYTPEFHVIDQNGQHEFHEVKGFWRDDARVKIKVAAEQCRWAQFVVVTCTKNAFKFEDVNP